jgi:hypothetical protein
LGVEELQGALGKRALIHLDPQGCFPSQIVVRSGLGLFVGDPIMRL